MAPGRNLAVLVESAVRNHLLRLKGYDATEVLIERQQQAIMIQIRPETAKPQRSLRAKLGFPASRHPKPAYNRSHDQAQYNKTRPWSWSPAFPVRARALH